jgi:TRAP-type C4-dicarboxylate transport system permease small subunit
LVAVLVAFVAAKSWAAVGVDYTSNLLNWYQQGSVLTLFGGLRGVGTRLTLLLALLGGSLATARGKHVVLDVVARFTPTRLRPALVVVGFSASALVALGAAWGFLDHIAIENFGATADSRMTGKIAAIVKGLDEDVFVLSRQLELDARSVRHVVLRGEGYADWLGGAEWNQFVESSGFPERFGVDAARLLAIPTGERRAAIVVVPGRGEPRGELIRAANLVFPVGLLVIALRFLLRGALVLSGHASVEADEEDDAIAGPATSAKGG